VVVALVLHDVPEGFAMANAYVVTRLGILVALAMALHNLPEEFAMAVPAVTLRGRRFLFGAGLLSALAEPVGAIVGLAAMGVAPSLNAAFLAFAAGAMLFVSVHELIPMARRYRHTGLFLAGAARIASFSWRSAKAAGAASDPRMPRLRIGDRAQPRAMAPVPSPGTLPGAGPITYRRESPLPPGCVIRRIARNSDLVRMAHHPCVGSDRSSLMGRCLVSRVAAARRSPAPEVHQGRSDQTYRASNKNAPVAKGSCSRLVASASHPRSCHPTKWWQPTAGDATS
jgi:hypothetical protein